MASAELLRFGNGRTVVSHCAGDLFSAAIDDNGQLYLWASEEDQDDHVETIPKPIDGFAHSVDMVAIGEEHFICALTTEKKLFSWGEGMYGQLGHGDKEFRGQPTLIAALADRETVMVACGGAHTVSLDSTGSVFTWGAAASGQLGHPQRIRRLTPFQLALSSEIVSIDCGVSHTVALTKGREVISWGLGDKGQLGRGLDASPLPELVPGLKEEIFRCGLPTQVKCGAYHTGIVTETGSVFMWGSGEDGQLGFEDTQNRYTPTELKIFGPHTVAKGLACSAQYSVAHTDDGSLYVWGALGADGQDLLLEPHKVQAARRKQGTAIISVSCSNKYVLALSEAGILCQWGPVSSISLDAAKAAFSGSLLTGQSGSKENPWKQTALIMRVVHRMESRLLRKKSRVFFKFSQIRGLASFRSSRILSCVRAMLHRGVRSAFNAWKNKHQEENRESEKRVTEELMSKISSAHDSKLRILHEEMSLSSSKLDAVKLNHACEKASLLLRDRVAWSLKRGFDKWSNFALAKEKEHDLKRTKMKLQVSVTSHRFLRFDGAIVMAF